MTHVNENIQEKLDFMTDRFAEIKDMIKAQIEEDSELFVEDQDAIRVEDEGPANVGFAQRAEER